VCKEHKSYRRDYSRKVVWEKERRSKERARTPPIFTIKISI
jgi:hypothetical protein